MQQRESRCLYIITGCSKGIGKALLSKLLQMAATHVIGISRTPVEEHPRLTHVQADLSNWQMIVEKLDKIFPQAIAYSKIVLINNAAWIGELKHIGNLQNRSIAAAYAINSIAPAILMNAYVQRYEQLKADKIVINVSTSAARTPRDGMSCYGSTKAALDMFTRIGREEAQIRESGIKYYIVSVGATDTPMQDSIRMATGDNFTTIQRFVDLKNSNGLLSPEEVAAAILAITQQPIATDDIMVYLKK